MQVERDAIAIEGRVPTDALPATGAARATRSLTDRVSGAFAFTLLQTGVAKIVGVAVQVVLARLLLREDFGLIALAYTVMMFISVFQRMGVRELLIQRQRRFAIWADAAFWLSMLTGLLAAGATAAVAPLAAAAYHRPQLTGLLLVLATSIPLANLAIVADARLRIELRFRLLCGYGVFSAVFVGALSMLLAYLRFGAYSFVLPLPIEALIAAFVYWSAAGQRPRMRLRVRRWRYMVGDTSLILAAYICFALVNQGDNMLLGFFESTVVVGVYYFAFNLSMQAIMLLVSNLFGVLLPSLATLQGQPGRQTDALLRAVRLMCIVCVPICFAQAAAADPLVRIFFGPKWYAAIPIMQVLCLAMPLHVLSWPAHSLMQAQGRFRTDVMLAAAMSGVLLILVFMAIHAGRGVRSGPWADAGFRTATAVAATYLIMLPGYLYAAIRPAGRGAVEVLRAAGGPFAAAAASAGLASVLAALVPPSSTWLLWSRLLLLVSVTLAVYAAIAWQLIPGTGELRDLAAQLIRRARPDPALQVAAPGSVA